MRTRTTLDQQSEVLREEKKSHRSNTTSVLTSVLEKVQTFMEFCRNAGLRATRLDEGDDAAHDERLENRDASISIVSWKSQELRGSEGGVQR